jgi:hypothetical protein
VHALEALFRNPQPRNLSPGSSTSFCIGNIILSFSPPFLVLPENFNYGAMILAGRITLEPFGDI